MNKEVFGKSPSLTCDPIPAPVMGIVKVAKTLKEDLQDILKNDSSTSEDSK